MSIAYQLEEALEPPLTEETVKDGLTSAIQSKDKRKIKKIVTFLTRRGLSPDDIADMAKDFTGISKADWNKLRGVPEIKGSAEEAAQKALKGEDGAAKVFDKLKSKQTVWMRWSSYGMGGSSREYQPYTVGRRSKSKKWGTTTVHLLRPGTTSSSPLVKLTLIKRSDGSVSLAEGDMAARIQGIWVP